MPEWWSNSTSATRLGRSGLFVARGRYRMNYAGAATVNLGARLDLFRLRYAGRPGLLPCRLRRLRRKPGKPSTYQLFEQRKGFLILSSSPLGPWQCRHPRLFALDCPLWRPRYSTSDRRGGVAGQYGSRSGVFTFKQHWRRRVPPAPAVFCSGTRLVKSAGARRNCLIADENIGY